MIYCILCTRGRQKQMLSRAFRTDHSTTPLWRALKIKNSFIQTDIVQETFFVSFYCNHYYYYCV